MTGRNLLEVTLFNNSDPPGKYMFGIFKEHSHDIFPEYSEKVPYEIPGNIPKIIFWEY